MHGTVNIKKLIKCICKYNLIFRPFTGTNSEQNLEKRCPLRPSSIPRVNIQKIRVCGFLFITKGKNSFGERSRPTLPGVVYSRNRTFKGDLR